MTNEDVGYVALGHEIQEALNIGLDIQALLLTNKTTGNKPLYTAPPIDLFNLYRPSRRDAAPLVIPGMMEYFGFLEIWDAVSKQIRVLDAKAIYEKAVSNQRALGLILFTLQKKMSAELYGMLYNEPDVWLGLKHG